MESTRVRVSTDGGFGPVWSRGGDELFFVNASRELVSASFDGASSRVTGLQALFEIPSSFPAVSGNHFFDVSTDGERFLMVRPFVDESESGEFVGFVLVQNFLEELERLVPN